VVYGGILEAHLQRVYDATVALLWKEYKQASGQIVSDEELPVPEALILISEMRSHNETLYWDGRWADQPYLLYLEFEQILRAEDEIKELIRINQRQKLNWSAGELELTQ
jgi:hypothetical protein